MTRVLAAPVEFSISNRDYGKSYNLLNNLRGDGLAVDAYVGQMETPVEAEEVTVHELDCSNRISYYWQCFRVARRALKDDDVDVYHHVNLSYRWFNPVLLGRGSGETSVVVGPCQAGHAIMAEEFNRMMSHAIGKNLPRAATDPLHLFVDGTRGLTVDPIRGVLFKRTLREADRIVVVHQDARDVYAELVDESKLEVIPLGVNPNQFEFTDDRDGESLVAIGNLRSRKGFDVLLRALADVVEQRPSVHLNVFGKGPQEEALQDLATELEVASNVTFHGFVDQSELKKHLLDARVFVHPSRSESFSLVRLEAMASGCPVVVTNTDGAKEMIRDGEEGFVVEPEAPCVMAKRILEILADDELTRRMARLARKRVEAKYDWRDIGHKYVDIYESLSES